MRPNKIICYRITSPIVSSSAAHAIYETAWNGTYAALFRHLLDELHSLPHLCLSLEMTFAHGVLQVYIAGAEPEIQHVVQGLRVVSSDLQIELATDPLDECASQSPLLLGRIKPQRSDALPLEEHFAFDSLEPTAASLSLIPENVTLFIQLLLRPASSGLARTSALFLKRQLVSGSRLLHPHYWFQRDLGLHYREKMKEKCKRKLFHVSGRVLAFMPQESQARCSESAHGLSDLDSTMDRAASALHFFSSYHENGLEIVDVAQDSRRLTALRTRTPSREFLLSSREISLLWHPPSLGLVNNAARAGATQKSPQAGLPKKDKAHSVCLLGTTNYQEGGTPFGILPDDRARHVLVAGKPNSEKTALLGTLAAQDIRAGYGCCILDADGALSTYLSSTLHSSGAQARLFEIRARQPSQLTINPFAAESDLMRRATFAAFFRALMAAYGYKAETKLEKLLWQMWELLSKTPGTTLQTFRDLLAASTLHPTPRSLTDSPALRSCLEQIRCDANNLPLLLFTINQLLSGESNSQLLCSTNRAPLDIAQLIEAQAILLVELDPLQWGREFSTFLGVYLNALMVQVAQARPRNQEGKRPSFYIFLEQLDAVLDPQFVAELSEARKFGIVYHLGVKSYSELPPAILQGLRGNIGHLCAFQATAQDARLLNQDFGDTLTVRDLMYLEPRHFYAKLTIKGKPCDVFSARLFNEGSVRTPVDSSASAVTPLSAPIEETF